MCLLSSQIWPLESYFSLASLPHVRIPIPDHLQSAGSGDTLTNNSRAQIHLFVETGPEEGDWDAYLMEESHLIKEIKHLGSPKGWANCLIHCTSNYERLTYRICSSFYNNAFGHAIVVNILIWKSIVWVLVRYGTGAKGTGNPRKRRCGKNPRLLFWKWKLRACC